jgi:hypothetical protein
VITVPALVFSIILQGVVLTAPQLMSDNDLEVNHAIKDSSDRGVQRRGADAQAGASEAVRPGNATREASPSAT